MSGALDTPLLDLRYGQVMTLLTVAAALVLIGVWGRDLTGARWSITPDAQAR